MQNPLMTRIGIEKISTVEQSWHSDIGWVPAFALQVNGDAVSCIGPSSPRTNGVLSGFLNKTLHTSNRNVQYQSAHAIREKTLKVQLCNWRAWREDGGVEREQVSDVLLVLRFCCNNTRALSLEMQESKPPSCNDERRTYRRNRALDPARARGAGEAEVDGWQWMISATTIVMGPVRRNEDI